MGEVRPWEHNMYRHDYGPYSRRGNTFTQMCVCVCVCIWLLFIFFLQESVMLKYLAEIPDWLARFARPAKTSDYPNWACFLKTFLQQGQKPIDGH